MEENVLLMSRVKGQNGETGWRAENRNLKLKQSKGGYNEVVGEFK